MGMEQTLMCRKTYAQQPMPGVIPLWCGLVVDTCKLEELFEVDQTIEAGDRSFTGSGHKSPATSRKRHLFSFRYIFKCLQPNKVGGSGIWCRLKRCRRDRGLDLDDFTLIV